METEFSLKGLSELLEKNGLRVVAGEEKTGSCIERLGGGARMVYRVEKIELTVTREKPAQGDGPGAGFSATRQGEG